MFSFKHFREVASRTQLKLVLQVLHLPDFLYQNHLALNLVQVVDDVLLGTDEAVGRELEFATQFQQDAVQFLVGSLLEKPPFLVQDEVFGGINQLLDVNPLLVQVLQLGNLYLVSRFVLERIVDAALQVHDVADGGTCNLLEGNLDVAHIALLARGNLLLLVVVHQFVQEGNVLVDDGRVDFLVRFEEQFEKVEEAGIQFHEVAVLADDFFLYEQFQPVFIVLEQCQCVGIAETQHLSFLEHFREQSPGRRNGIDNFVNRSEYIHSLVENSGKVIICPPIFLMFRSDFPPLAECFSGRKEQVPVLPCQYFSTS